MFQPHRDRVNTALGTREVDSAGSPVGVARISSDLSYAGVGLLLQSYINDHNQSAWKTIKDKIDYTYEHLDLALAPILEATGFNREVKTRVARGQKLLFKPNLVSVNNIDPQTHGPDSGSTAATEWPFVAALLRWFHVRLGISYHQMSVGEATPGAYMAAGSFSMLNPEGRRVTTEATIEGRCGNFYGGWGFYFARQYLAETLEPGRTDDPRRGYDESVSGTYLSPGRAGDRLMVYDLNRLAEDQSRGREVEVADGVNFRSVTLHKVIVGGDPADATDRDLYPGCVLVNVPRLKVHSQALFTNAIKNLGIGLFPMESERGGSGNWQYAFPPGAMPGVKGGVPHQTWVADLDMPTGLPQRDAEGKAIVHRTGGLPATMIDVVKAVNGQDIFTIHVVDAIEAIGRDHTNFGQREPEGLVVAGLDPVAIDLLCARYMFGNVPMAEAEQSGITDGCGGFFPQRVPIPAVDGGNIVTRSGYDCPLRRDVSLSRAEQRGLGQRAYHVLGGDALSQRPLVSVGGRLGSVVDGTFAELTTRATYYAVQKMPWDLQATAFGYLEAVDQLTGSGLKQEFLATFDEDGDGVVGYEESGLKSLWAPRLFVMSVGNTIKGTEPFGYLRGPFSSSALLLKYRQTCWNAEGLSVFDEYVHRTIGLTALNLSRAAVDSPDPFQRSLTWGKGKWPSYQLASFVEFGGILLYGPGFPAKVGIGGLYGLAFSYADATQNGGRYVGGILSRPEPEAVALYTGEVASKQARPLDFTLYVPIGWAEVAGQRVLNVEETADAARVFTASFAGGAEVWPPARAGLEVHQKAAVIWGGSGGAG